MDEGEPLLERPLGRRIFLGLMGAGAAGLLWEKHLLSADDITSPGQVAQVIRLGPPDAFATPQAQREALEGQHPNLSGLSERFRYYSVGTIPGFDEPSWRLRVGGEGVGAPLSLSYAQLKAFPNYADRSTFRCVTGWRVPDCVWRGVRLRDVLAAARPNRSAQFVSFASMDGVYTESLTWQQAISGDALLVWELNGAPLIREQGYPLRLIYPDMYGYKNIKWLTRIDVLSRREYGFWEVHDGWEVDAYVYNPDLVRQTGG